MVHRKSSMFTENRAETSELEKLIFLICFIFFKKMSKSTKWVNRMCTFSLSFCCKKFSSIGTPSEKLCLFYGRYLELWFPKGTTRQEGRRQLGQSFPFLQTPMMAKQSFSASNPRACISLICSNRYLPDESMEGCDARRRQGGLQPI